MNRIADIDLRLLRVFVAVAESGGYALAQPVLNIGSSTISLHMSDLERRLGFRLCERGRGGFQLTDRGEQAYEEVKRLLERLDDFSGSMANLKKRLAGHLRFGMVDCLVTNPDFPLSRTLRRFNQLDNGVKIEIVVESRTHLESGVLSGGLHAAIGPLCAPGRRAAFPADLQGAAAPLLRRRPSDLQQRADRVHRGGPLAAHRRPARLPGRVRPAAGVAFEQPGRRQHDGGDAGAAAERRLHRIAAGALRADVGRVRRAEGAPYRGVRARVDSYAGHLRRVPAVRRAGHLSGDHDGRTAERAAGVEAGPAASPGACGGGGAAPFALG
ncbi:MAG: LysR family transcriptional regulator [Acetobacteraceae bacterium]